MIEIDLLGVRDVDDGSRAVLGHLTADVN